MESKLDKKTKLKWCAIGFNFNPVRYELLSAWLTSQGIENELDLLNINPSSFQTEFKTVTETYDQIRVESPHGLNVYNYFKSHEALMSQLKAVDCVFKDNLSHWWCRSLTYKSLCEAFQGVGELIELDLSVLIVGSGAAARAALAACTKMGFKKFKITNKYDDQALEMIREMRENFFGLNFEFVPQNKLTLLPGANCIVINTTPNVASNDLLKELYYFNFLKRNGVVVDLNFSPVYTQLIKESLEIKNFVIYGYELAAISDAYWVEWVTNQAVDRDLIKDFYRNNLMESPKASTKDEKIE